MQMLMKAGLLTADHRGPKIAKGPTDPLFPVIGLQILRASDPGLPTPNYRVREGLLRRCERARCARKVL